jgi:uncharacterized protein
VKINHIWIDADSCPTLVRNHCIKIGRQMNISVTLVANKNIPCTEQPFEMIICGNEKDSADNYILEHCETSALVITRDIVFADKLVEKKINCINDRGTVFCTENIKKLLSERNFDFMIAQTGVVKHISEGYSKKNFSQFASCFDKIIHQDMH